MINSEDNERILKIQKRLDPLFFDLSFSGEIGIMDPGNRELYRTKRKFSTEEEAFEYLEKYAEDFRNKCLPFYEISKKCRKENIYIFGPSVSTGEFGVSDVRDRAYYTFIPKIKFSPIDNIDLYWKIVDYIVTEMKRTREELIKVFDDTLAAIKVGGYRSVSGDWIEFTNPLKGSKFYQSLKPISGKDLPIFSNPKVYVENIDTFQKAEVMGNDCAVLNMASFQNAGGGVINGSRAQEEELCRRSNLVQSLYAYSSRDSELLDYKEPSKDKRYPISMYGGIYSPHVMVFRSALSYSMLDEPYECAVISVPGLKNPTLDKKTGELTEKDATTTKGKIRAILRIALLNGHYKLVLGALGCGAFHNPPKHIARLFKEVIGEDEFENHFEEICFAILEDGNSLKNQAGGNLKPFKEVFG